MTTLDQALAFITRQRTGIALLTLALAAPLQAATIPLTDVVLFTSGVGYFEHGGTVSGDTEAALAFPEAQMPDVIKSLVVMDEGGGTVSSVTFPARDPMNRTLRSFRVDLSDQPTLPTLVQRLRGATVQVTAGGTTITGEIIGVEARPRRLDGEIITEWMINLFSDGALRPVPLEQVLRIEPRDAAIRADFAAALATLAGALDEQARTLRIRFDGKGERPVRLGYMIETPLWKTSYRLVLSEDGPALLQGWAHVENMTDADWTGIQLELVSGEPVSFIQNLYDPLYRQRPVVHYELGGVTAPPMLETAAKGFGVGAAVAFDGFADAEYAAAPASAPMMRNQVDSARRRVDASSMRAAAPPAAEGRATGELFAYRIETPVHLPRHQSAMLPIVSQSLSVQPVSIFNHATHTRRPMSAVVFDNTSGLFLMQGPVTLFEDGVYAGDARLEDTPRGANRILAYAIDLTTEITRRPPASTEQITRMKINRGLLEITRSMEQRTLYQVASLRDKARMLYIDHPIRPEWSLIEPATGVEQTPGYHRIRREIPAGGAVEIGVVERRMLSQTAALTDINLDTIAIHIQQATIAPAVKAALEKLAALRTALNQTAEQRSDRERRMAAIAAEQKRIRDNMGAVNRNSEAFGMWEQRLIQQERELDTLRTEAERLRDEERRQREEMQNWLQNLSL